MLILSARSGGGQGRGLDAGGQMTIGKALPLGSSWRPASAALTLRCSSPSRMYCWTCGDLSLTPAPRTAAVSGQTLTLTRKGNVGILEYLMVHRGGR